MSGPPTPNWHETLVTVSDSNFSEVRYLAANPDLRAAKQKDPTFDSRAHFDKYGRHEGRKLLAIRDPEFMAGKFRRFQSILNLDDCEFMAELGTFPISFGGDHPRLSDYDGESSNPGITPWFDALRADPDGHYLDLGCGFRPIVHDNCAYLEVYPSLTADIVTTPGRRLPFKDHVLDGLACLSVLEHVEDPFFLVGEIGRVVRSGGRIFVDWPFLQPVHGYPSHYYNATRMGLVRAFERTFAIESISTNNSQGAAFTLSWILQWFVQGLEEGPPKQKLLAMAVRDLVELNPRDDLYRRCLQAMSDEMQMKLACGNTLIGRRLPE